MSDRRKLTREERQTVLDRFCCRCAYCGKQITMQELAEIHLSRAQYKDLQNVIDTAVAAIEHIEHEEKKKRKTVNSRQKSAQYEWLLWKLAELEGRK